MIKSLNSTKPKEFSQLQKLTRKVVVSILLASILQIAAPYSLFWHKIPSIKAEGADPEEWYMVGANPQRTSWIDVSSPVTGTLSPEWYRPIDSFIPYRTQIIAANDMLYISSEKGLLALSTGDNPAYGTAGSQVWFYPTDMPLGNSPTIYNDVAYVGGFDHKIHAINAITGAGLWTYEAQADDIGAGFDTNPLVVNNIVYAGNRDGYMYAIYAQGHAQAGQLAWSYKTDGPIHFSAAMNSTNSTIYFASDDSYAYALNATTGALVWKSAKLPSAGFRSWWPVVVDNTVIFGGARPYRFKVMPQTNWGTTYYTKGMGSLFSTYGPLGTTNPDGTVDASRAFEWSETEGHLRSYFILNQSNGTEVTYNIDSDGNQEYAPLFWSGTNSGNIYPPAVDSSNKLYLLEQQSSDANGNWGSIASWQLGATVIDPFTDSQALDEPTAYSIGGNVIYYNKCCDREAGAFNLTDGTKWTYFQYNLDTLAPGYNAKTTGSAFTNISRVYGDNSGIYGVHGEQNPPIPYKGKVYFHRSNAIIAWSATGGATNLGLLTPTAQTAQYLSADTTALTSRLNTEVQKIITAGHLRPGFGPDGSFGYSGKQQADLLGDYWHSAADTIYYLTLAYPHLTPTLQSQVLTYLQTEYSTYIDYNHFGWAAGANRQSFDFAPEVTADLATEVAGNYYNWDFNGFTPDPKENPFLFYSLWKYAQLVGNNPTTALNLLSANAGRLKAPPDAATLQTYPYAHNAYIAGYRGYLELQALAGVTETESIRNTYNQLLADRVTNFNKNLTNGPDDSATNARQFLAVSGNFLYLTPELGAYLNENAPSAMQTAYNEYKVVAPYWFVSFFEADYGENTINNLYTKSALFNAQHYIFDAPQNTLTKYLDVPGFPTGDYFYIEQLVAILESTPVIVPTPTPTPTPVPTSTPTPTPTAVGNENPVPRTTWTFETDSTDLEETTEDTTEITTLVSYPVSGNPQNVRVTTGDKNNSKLDTTNSSSVGQLGQFLLQNSWCIIIPLLLGALYFLIRKRQHRSPDEPAKNY